MFFQVCILFLVLSFNYKYLNLNSSFGIYIPLEELQAKKIPQANILDCRLN